jgi:DNA-binding IclR family transcriptional regulator
MLVSTDLPTPERPPEPGLSVVQRLSAILAAFAGDVSRLGLSELSRQAAMPKPTVYRLCQELVAVGILHKVGTEYELGGRLFELGQRVPRSQGFREAALPFMEDLYVTTRETVHLGVLDAAEVLYLEKIMGHRGVHAPSRVAGRMPLHCTASGKAILAGSTPALTEQVIRDGLAPRTRYTVRDPARLRAQVAEARQRGYAIEMEEVLLGYASVAVPVCTRSGLVGALAVTGAIAGGDPRRWAPAVRASAHALTSTLATHPL